MIILHSCTHGFGKRCGLGVVSKGNPSETKQNQATKLANYQTAQFAGSTPHPSPRPPTSHAELQRRGRHRPGGAAQAPAWELTLRAIPPVLPTFRVKFWLSPTCLDFFRFLDQLGGVPTFREKFGLSPSCLDLFLPCGSSPLKLTFTSKVMSCTSQPVAPCCIGVPRSRLLNSLARAKSWSQPAT